MGCITDICFSVNSGEGDVHEPRWNDGTIQPHQEMLQVLSLRVGDCPGIGWSEWVSRDFSLFFDVVRDRVDECLVAVRKTQDDGVALRRHQRGVLTIHNSPCLVTVFIDDHLHASVRQDGGVTSHCRTGNVAEGLLASKELFNYQSVHPLGCCLGHGYDAGLQVGPEGLEGFLRPADIQRDR